MGQTPGHHYTVFYSSFFTSLTLSSSWGWTAGMLHPIPVFYYSYYYFAPPSPILKKSQSHRLSLLDLILPSCIINPPPSPPAQLSFSPPSSVLLTSYIQPTSHLIISLLYSPFSSQRVPPTTEYIPKPPIMTTRMKRKQDEVEATLQALPSDGSDEEEEEE